METVHFVTQDPIQHLRVRVTLTRLSAAQPLGPAQQQDQAAAPPGRTAAGAAGATTTVAEAAAADGSGADAAAGASRAQGARARQFQAVRTFGWQEKVYSRAELVAAQAQQHGAPPVAAKRAAHFGSQSHISTDRLQASALEGSVLFSHVQTDSFCERYETSRRVTTSAAEHRSHLARRLATDPRNRQKMLNFQSMFILADLGGEHSRAGAGEHVLCAIRAYAGGGFDMTPGFNKPGHKYRFEDEHGGMYEYTLELVSQAATPTLEKRAAKLAASVAAQAEQLRSVHSCMEHMPPPGPNASALRLVLLGELVSAAGFTRDRLYLEWQLVFDPEVWLLQHSEQSVVQPGLIQGVTHVSRMVQYPADPASDTPATWVAHFAHPLEVEWVARRRPAPRDWPKLLLQVSTLDLWDRCTTEGYGWLQLGGNCCPGSSTQYISTWKPLGSVRDQQAAFFIGGSRELADLSYAAVPRGHSGRVLNKYGYVTTTSGTVKVRLHTLLQTGADGGTSPRKAVAASRVGTGAAARQRRELSLAVVLERARTRLQEARGGEVEVREGVVVQRPSITLQPADVSASEGGTVQFRVAATGLGPLAYQWFKDGKRLSVATSASPLLVLVDLAPGDAGSYHCQVSNRDGSAVSSKALLSVARVGRLAHATGGSSAGGTADGASSSSGGDRVGREHSPPPGVSAASETLLSQTFSKRATIPRSLPAAGSRAGSGLPYTPRLAGTSGGSPGGSPLRLGRSLAGSTAAAAGAPQLRGTDAAGGGDAAERLDDEALAAQLPAGMFARQQQQQQPSSEGRAEAPDSSSSSSRRGWASQQPS